MYNYNDKFRGQDGRRSIFDILSLDGTEIDENGNIILHQYEAVDIHKVKIDAYTFTNYGQYQFIWEKTFVKSPERSSSGSIDNLNSYATFLTPHLIINFSLMSIDDYRTIMKMHYEKNEFVVKCYDPIYNKPITQNMYFGTEQMAKLYTINRMRNGTQGEWEDWIELVGVQDYSVELIGTNTDLTKVSVVYHLNPPSDTEYADQTIGEEDVYNGDDILIGSSATNFTNETFGGLYKFKHWTTTSTDSDKGIYINGNAYTINAPSDDEHALVLYAQWQSTTEHTLTYNYGLADPAINDSSYTYINSKPVSKGQSIGNLPNVEPPKVKYKDIYDGGKEKEKTDVYHTPEWWKIPQKAQKFDENGNDITNTLKVRDNALYWSDRDSTIYLLYETTKYLLRLKIENAQTHIAEDFLSNQIAYNTPMNLPYPVKSGYTFDGWYYTSDFKEGTKISGNMTPYDVVLYGRWKLK